MHQIQTLKPMSPKYYFKDDEYSTILNFIFPNTNALVEFINIAAKELKINIIDDKKYDFFKKRLSKEIINKCTLIVKQDTDHKEIMVDIFNQVDYNQMSEIVLFSYELILQHQHVEKKTILN